MKFQALNITGAYAVDPEPREDARGAFARMFCQKEFTDHGIDFQIAQINLATTKAKGTFRGLHYQVAPSKEAKFIRCTRGRLFDVMVDTRPDSPTYLQCYGAILTADDKRGLLIPANCAHGYLTLEDDTEALYAAADVYNPPLERGLRHDDPIVKVDWPIQVLHISDKDRAWPDYTPEIGANA